MEVIKQEAMIVKCEHCKATVKSDDVKDFKESMTYPPYVSFLCPSCKQIANLYVGGMPDRVMALLVNKISVEKGFSDQETFNNMETI